MRIAFFVLSTLALAMVLPIRCRGKGSCADGTAGHVNNLVADLEAIQEASFSCATSVGTARGSLTSNVLEPAKANKSSLEDARFIYSFTQKVKSNADRLLSVARFVPKFGRVAESAIHSLVKLDRYLGKLLEETKEFEDSLDEIMKALEDQISKLETMEIILITTGDVAETSATAVSVAQSCATETDSSADDDALELFACLISPDVSVLRSTTELCPGTIQAVLNTVPSGLKLLADTLVPVSVIRGPIEATADELLAVLDIVAQDVTEVLCCSIPPHLQSFGEALSNTINLAECFAGALIPTIDNFLDEVLAATQKDFSWPSTTLSFDVISSPPLTAAEDGLPSCSVADFAVSLASDVVSTFIPAVNAPFIAPEIESDTCALSGLDPTSWWGGDCCCQARGTILESGTACLKFEVFATPGLYELAAAASGLERCTCCEGGEYVSCSGQTAVCGSELPPPKKVNEACPSTGNDCFCEGDLPCASLVSGDYICCPSGSWSSETDFKEYCKAMAGPGESCPGIAGANDNYCKDGGECGLRASSDDDYICCEHGTSICGISDCCKYSAEIGEGCYQDDQCKSGLCNCGDTRLCASEGVCVESNVPVGGACATTHDEQCAGEKPCARDFNDNYICCPNGSWNSGVVEYCRSMAEPGERCPGGAVANDNYCKNGKPCALNAVEGQYVCCDRGSASSVQDGKEYCKLTLRAGDRCVLNEQCDSPDRDCDCPGWGPDTCYVGTCE